MASPTPLGIHQISSGEQYALVQDLNRVGVTTDAAIAFVKDRAEYLTDKAVAEAGELSRRALNEARGLSRQALNELPGRVVAEVDRVIGDTREDAAEALAVANQAYEYNQTLIAPAAAVVNAVVTDPATPAGALVGSKVSVGDTYVGVTQQPGETMKDKLHEACRVASETNGVVLLPPFPIDVGTGFSMAGYTCGMVGQGYSGMHRPDPDKYVQSSKGSGLYASQQAGSVLDMRGFIWHQAFEGRVPFRGFHLRGNNVVDTTRTNVGLRIESGYDPTGTFKSVHAGAGVLDFDLTILECGGGAVYANRWYHCKARFTISVGAGTGAANIPAMICDNVTNIDADLHFFSPELGGNQVMPEDGLLVVRAWQIAEGAEPFRSNLNKWDVVFENFHTIPGSTGVSLQSRGNELMLRTQDIMPVGEDVTGSAAIRVLPKPANATTVGGQNRIHGALPMVNAPRTFEHPIELLESGNIVEGSREYGSHVVRIGPGVKDSYINLRGTYNSQTSFGVVDDSGLPGQNTILDYTVYPHDGRNPTPATLASNVACRTEVKVNKDAYLSVRGFRPNSTYSFTATVPYTTLGDGMRIGVDAVTTSMPNIESWFIDGLPHWSDTNAIIRKAGTGFGHADMKGGEGTVTVTGTIRTDSTITPASWVRVWWARRVASESSLHIRRGASFSVERVA